MFFFVIVIVKVGKSVFLLGIYIVCNLVNFEIKIELDNDLSQDVIHCLNSGN